MGVADTRSVIQHTGAALRRGVRSCYAQIAVEANHSTRDVTSRCPDALRPTILGEHRQHLAKSIGRMHEHATITEGTKRYRHLTKQKAMQKQRKIATDGVWGGWAPDRPVLRLGGAAAVHAPSPSAGAHAAQARRWLGRARKSPLRVKAATAKAKQVPRRPVAPLGEATSGHRRPAAPVQKARPGIMGGVKPKRPKLRTLMSETVLVVKSKLGDGTSADDLRKWLVAVAFGKPVLVDSGPGPVERVRFKPALYRAQNVRFTQKFASRHPGIEKLTSSIAMCKGSKWRVCARGSLGAASRNVVDVDSCASFVHLLRSVMVRG